MFRLKLLITAFFVASVLSEGLGGENNGNEAENNSFGKDMHKHHKKMMQCMKQTQDLQECCPFPKDESAKDDPECKEHLEGIEQKEGKEKHKAHKCWMDCVFTSNGLIEGNDLKKDKILEAFNETLIKLDAEDFKDISETSVEFCYSEILAIQAKWEKWSASWNKTEDTSSEEKKCNFLPVAFTACVLGNVVRNCPESKWQNTKECTALNEASTSMEECMKH